MSKFKKGDVVRVTSVDSSDIDARISVGMIGVVKDDCVAPYVQFGTMTRAMEQHQLELVEAKPAASRKWILGQQLNSAAEVMQALLDGEKIRGYWWGAGSRYIHLVDGKIQFTDGTEFHPDLNFEGWYIYTPPKRKVKSERWFAVVKHPNASDVVWHQLASEAQARSEVPNALDYIRAECEVEVEE